jgi:hypothetical protein
VSTKERFKAMWSMFVAEIGHLETTKANHEDVKAAIQLALVYEGIRLLKLLGKDVPNFDHYFQG